MKLTIESDGTWQGTNLEFQMNGEEIPKILEARAKKKRLKHRGPPDVIISSEFFVVDLRAVPPELRPNWPLDSAAPGG